MNITINNQIKSINAETIQQLMDMEMPEKQKGVAVAVNNSVVPKTEWTKHKINPNDAILIIKATQGG
jgi:sulfur carrier protein